MPKQKAINSVAVEVPFEQEVPRVLADLRGALSESLDELRPPVTRPTDLHRLLGLDQKLGWRVFNAARAEDVCELAPLVPGRRPMERFLSAVSSQGVPEETIERVRAAFGRFEAAVSRHARSRDAFEAMVADLGGGSCGEISAAADLKHKRSMFHAASVLCGQQARLSQGMMIIHPSEQKAGKVDLAVVVGKLGLHRTRRGAPLQAMAGYHRHQNKGAPDALPTPEPIDPRETGPDAVGLLRDFCSEPLPRFRTIHSEGNDLIHELMAEGLGTGSEVSYYTAHVSWGETAVPGTAPGAGISFIGTVGVPTEMYISDVLIHESLWDERPPAVEVFGMPSNRKLHMHESRDMLPVRESASYLGKGLYAGRTQLLPEHGDILSYVTGRLGWNPEEFRLFRCLIECPILYTRIRLRFDAEEGDGG